MALRDDCQTLVDRLNARVGADLTLTVSEVLAGRRATLSVAREGFPDRIIMGPATLRQVKAWLSAFHRVLEVSQVAQWRAMSADPWRSND